MRGSLTRYNYNCGVEKTTIALCRGDTFYGNKQKFVTNLHNAITDIIKSAWRDGRVVEGARLESVCASNGTAGSNPVLSAKNLYQY
jgi:hypothetical protein